MKKTFYTLWLSLPLLVSSCSPVKMVQYWNDSGPIVERQVTLTKHDKEVILLPVTLTAKPETYAAAKDFVEQKRSQGYSVYYQGIDTDSFSSEEEKDTWLRQMRKFVGHVPRYSAKEGPFLPTNVKKKHLPLSYTALGINKDTDKAIDLSAQELIEKMTAKGYDLTLTPYDLQTPLGSQYGVKDVLYYSNQKKVEEITTHHIVQKMNNASEDKILLIYELDSRQNFVLGMNAKGFKDDFFVNFPKKL